MTSKSVVMLKELPSNGMIYPMNETIGFHPFTFGEVFVFNRSRFNLIQKYNFLMSGIVIENEGMKVEDLTIPDFLFINLYRKLSSIRGSGFSVEVVCGWCNETVEIKFKGTDIEFSDLKDKYPVTTKLSIGEFQWSPLTVGDTLDLIKENNGVFPSDKMRSFVKQIRNKKYDKRLVDEIRSVSDGSDMIVLDSIDRRMDHGVKPIVKKCPNKKCNKNIRFILDNVDSMVYPRSGRREVIKTRICNV